MIVPMSPIGVVHSNRSEAIDDMWDQVTSTIELDPSVLDRSATVGLETFSHIEVIFVFDGVDPVTVCTGQRHPRGNEHWPSVGILAQRAKDRPNRIGITTCTLLRVEGLRVHVRGLDAIDGTPVLDIKPFMHEFAPRGAIVQPVWASELMAQYW